MPSVASRAKNGGGGVIGDETAHGRNAGAEAPQLVPPRPLVKTVGSGPQKYHDVVVTGDEGEFPREPLAVFPVEPQMVTGRSHPGCWRMDDRMQQQQQQEGEDEEEEGNVCGLSGGAGGSGSAAVDPSRFAASIARLQSAIAIEHADALHSSCCSAGSYMSPRSMVVRIDALYALQGRSGCFNGNLRSRYGGGGGGGGGVHGGDGTLAEGVGLYLVLDNSRFSHRTVTRRRHEETFGADLEGYRRAPQASERQSNRVDEWANRGGNNVNDPTLAIDAWIFNESVALPVAITKREVNGRQQGRGVMLAGDDDDNNNEGDEENNDDLLCVRVYTAGELPPSTGLSSSAPPSRSRTPAHQHTDAAAAAAGEAVVADEMVGSAMIPLRRHLATAGSGDVSSGARAKCTFSRLKKVSVVSPEGAAIGWIGIHVCAT